MSVTQRVQPTRVDQFFTGTEARMDRWRGLLRLAREWQAASKQGKGEQERSKVVNALSDLRQWEDFFAYPGQQLLSRLEQKVAASDATGAARLAQNLSTSLLTRSYRTNQLDWSDEELDPVRFSDKIPGSEET